MPRATVPRFAKVSDLEFLQVALNQMLGSGRIVALSKARTKNRAAVVATYDGGAWHRELAVFTITKQKGGPRVDLMRGKYVRYTVDVELETSGLRTLYTFLMTPELLQLVDPPHGPLAVRTYDWRALAWQRAIAADQFKPPVKGQVWVFKEPVEFKSKDKVQSFIVREDGWTDSAGKPHVYLMNADTEMGDYLIGREYVISTWASGALRVYEPLPEQPPTVARDLDLPAGDPPQG